MTAPERPSGSSGDPVLAVACREFVELVTEHLEGTLPEHVERAVAAHLALCEPCVEYLEQTRATVRLLGGMPAPSLPPVVRDRLLDVYAQLRSRRPGTGPDAADG